MLVQQIPDKVLLNLSREAIDPTEAGGHWNAQLQKETELLNQCQCQ